MPAYNLTAPQLAILTSFLFEEGGYLDAARNDLGVTARSALAADAGLDIAQWIRTQTPAPDLFALSDWEECGMVWWIRAHDQVNITPPTKPPEAAAWALILQTWIDAVSNAFSRFSEAIRNQKAWTVTAEDGTTSTMPGGAALTQERQMYQQVLGVLQ